MIFVTGKNDTENELLGLNLGAVDYITKPFSPPLLLKRVEMHLLLREQRNVLRTFSNNLLKMVDERTKDITNLQKAILMWSAEVIEYRDEETGQHVERVQKYMGELIAAMKKSDNYSAEIARWDIDAFIKSAILHDIGKLKISDSILLKPERLTDEEREKMQSHTTFGKMLIESLQAKVPDETFLEYAKILAYSHHERWDGTGYPGKKQGEEIPLQARMMAFADVYDALIAERPYKKAFTHEESMRIIYEGRGTIFDPFLTDLFIGISDRIEHISKSLT